MSQEPQSSPTSEQERLDAASLEAGLTALLSRHPEAPIFAAGPDGLHVAVPDSLQLGNNPELESAPSLNLVLAQDRFALVEAWDRALATGGARCLFRLSGPPVQSVVYHVFDLREKHGVLVAVVLAEQADVPVAVDRATLTAVPRFARLHKDERGFITSVDESITQLLGWGTEDMVGRRAIDFIHPDDHALAIESWMEMLASPGLGRRVRLRHRRHSDQAWVWFEVTNQNLLDDLAHGCVVSEMLDISEEMAAHETVKAREELLDRLAEAIPMGLFQIDSAQRIVYTNARLHDILGVESADTAEAQLATVIDEDWPVVSEALVKVVTDGLAADVEITLRPPPGDELRFCTVNLRALRRDDGTINGAIASVADVTDGARMRSELKRRATYDELTGCHNRASIMHALEANIAEDAARRAVMFLDLDGFKQINDQHGHAAGDELLRVVGQRLRSAVRAEDTVGRFGGDEFLVICPDIEGRAQAIALAEQLSAAVRRDISLAAGDIAHQISIGVGWSQGNDTDADQLVAAADRAMYASKRERAGRPKLASIGRVLQATGSPSVRRGAPLRRAASASGS